MKLNSIKKFILLGAIAATPLITTTSALADINLNHQEPINYSSKFETEFLEKYNYFSHRDFELSKISKKDHNSIAYLRYHGYTDDSLISEMLDEAQKVIKANQLTKKHPNVHFNTYQDVLDYEILYNRPNMENGELKRIGSSHINKIEKPDIEDGQLKRIGESSKNYFNNSNSITIEKPDIEDGQLKRISGFIENEDSLKSLDAKPELPIKNISMNNLNGKMDKIIDSFSQKNEEIKDKKIILKS